MVAQGVGVQGRALTQVRAGAGPGREEVLLHRGPAPQDPVGLEVRVSPPSLGVQYSGFG